MKILSVFIVMCLIGVSETCASEPCDLLVEARRSENELKVKIARGEVEKEFIQILLQMHRSSRLSCTTTCVLLGTLGSVNIEDVVELRDFTEASRDKKLNDIRQELRKAVSENEVEFVRVLQLKLAQTTAYYKDLISIYTSTIDKMTRSSPHPLGTVFKD